MIALLLAAAVWAAEPAVCQDDLEAVPEMVPVAWVSRGRERVGNNGWLEVVRAQDLAVWLAKDRPTLARVLQLLGERKRSTPPKRPYKITIFEVRSIDLCRPIEGAEGTTVTGLAACAPAQSRATKRASGCGYSIDRSTGRRGIDTYRIQWRHAAARGFCVLPAQRYLDEAAR